MRGTFDVFIDSTGFSSVAPESTYFLETLWRRREPVPEASGANRAPGALSRRLQMTRAGTSFHRVHDCGAGQDFPQVDVAYTRTCIIVRV